MRAVGIKSRYSSVVERVIGNDEGEGSIPSGGTIYLPWVVAAFWSKVDVRTARGHGARWCWPWRASVDRHGYGQFRAVKGSNPFRAHRVAWEIWNAKDVPDGLLILHSCANPRCCNPNHLRPGTVAENSADMVLRGRSRRAAARLVERT
jgi:hypothetical protein